MARAGLMALIGVVSLGIGSPVRAQSTQGADVIIVGAGISGLSAALEAARGGVEVQIVDVWSVYGGHAVMSGGGVAIIDSDFQRAQGIVDTPELASEDFFSRGEDPDPYWVDYYTRNSRAELGQWLESLGVRWLSLNPQPGNSVRRFHRTDGRGLGLVTPIYREVLRHANVSFRWNFRVTELLVEQGRVVGVRARIRGTAKPTNCARRECFSPPGISEQPGDGQAFLAGASGRTRRIAHRIRPQLRGFRP